MKIENLQEFNPNERWIELSISEKDRANGRVIRTAEIVARHLFINPTIKEISQFGTRSMITVDVEGDREWAPYDVLTTMQARERAIIRKTVAAADTPHESWILDPNGYIKF